MSLEAETIPENTTVSILLIQLRISGNSELPWKKDPLLVASTLWQPMRTTFMFSVEWVVRSGSRPWTLTTSLIRSGFSAGLQENRLA
ncbi:BnaC05g36850D [Brassica napus]|uniref:(rape) hypothetical protein n=1 Tax=Brassica napus TaxID=3708 RepID=A0A078HYY0_BRANA|nr:unnamed protein product [Brassica napus]CDY43092.1 BnaC05g36850D [Brassica napus]